MEATARSTPLPTQLRTERLLLRSADINNDADCDKINYIRAHAAGGPKHFIKSGSEARQELRYKTRVHGPRQDLCTLAPAPANIFWLVWLPASHSPGEDQNVEEKEDLTDLVGLIVMSFRQEMPMPDMGYVTVEAHAGRGYAAEAGREVLRYWRDLVGVSEIFVGCPVENVKSQRCAERIGFVHGGTLLCEMGTPPDLRMEEAVAYVLPGMRWEEGHVVRPRRGWGPDEFGVLELRLAIRLLSCA